MLHRLVSAALIVTNLAIGISIHAAPLERFEYSDIQMGILFRLVFYADSRETADEASQAVFGRIAGLNRILSDWDKESELSQLMRAEAGPFRPVSEELYTVLEHSIRYSRLSSGAFDVTAGPLVTLWRLAGARGKLPDPEQLQAVRHRVGFSLVQLDEGRKSVSLRQRGVRIDLGGIAKGYALDEAMAVLRGLGIERALVDGGGDVLVSNAPPGRSGWSIRVVGESSEEDTGQILELANLAVATSGDLQQSWQIDGTRYSHIVDPRSGRALTRAARTTVIAATGIQADAVATALCVLSPDEGLSLAAKLPGTCAEIVRRTDDRLEVFASDCFPH